MDKFDLKLEYITDNRFKEFILECRKRKIQRRQILSVTTHLNKNTFSEEAFFRFFDEKHKFPKRGVAYIPEYISLRNNISIPCAIKYIDKYKQNKATSKDGFIKRYGKIDGMIKFTKFQETSRQSTSDEWFKQRYGRGWESKKSLAMKTRSKWCIEYWISKGQTEEMAIKSVSEYQMATAGANKTYWYNLGLSSDEVDIILARINKAKGYNNRNRAKWQKIYGLNWKEKYREYANNYRQNMERFGAWIANDLKSEWRKYHSLCWYYTNQSIFQNEVLHIEKRSTEWHLDHKYSIKQGFIDGVDPKIIGSAINLEIIHKLQNCRKQSKCSIDLNHLNEVYYNYENQKNHTLCQ
jgi:hypothetical protein